MSKVYDWTAQMCSKVLRAAIGNHITNRAKIVDLEKRLKSLEDNVKDLRKATETKRQIYRLH